jgi:biopolymer transport protein ExbD
MAGGGFDSPEPSGGHRKKKKWQKGKRLGVRIDMTPMVDVILLLLTFFILTTTLNTPQIMQINLPKGEEEDKVKVDMANVLYIRVSGQGNIFFSQGLADGSEMAPQNVSLDNMRNSIEQRHAQNPNLLMLLKFDREMPYSLMIDILDEINRARTEGKRYTFMRMEDIDREIVRLAEG